MSHPKHKHDDLEIPEFLRREPGESPLDQKIQPLSPEFDQPVQPIDVSQDRWRKLENERKEHKKRKARGRIATMLAKKADQEAVKAGKIWDAIKAEWRDTDG